MTVDGLLYESADGELDYIDFEDCYQRWVDWKLQYSAGHSLPTDAAQLRERTQGWKEIGSRDSFNTPPYIVFYCERQIRFDFETYEEISDFRRRMYNLGGWHTFDLA